MFDFLTIGTIGPKFTRPACRYAADDAHRPPQHGFAAAARAAIGQTNGKTDMAPF